MVEVKSFSKTNYFMKLNLCDPSCLRALVVNKLIYTKCLLIIFSVLFSKCFSQPASNSFSSNPKYKKVEIGMNAGPLGETRRFRKALNAIRKDGFTDIRVYEPFTKRMVPYKDKVTDYMDSLVNDGFKVLLSLNNYPYPWLKDSVNEPDYITRSRKFTNRFPPDLKQYETFLISILDEFSKRGILKDLIIEIGNEPDADLFFWGTPVQFMEIYHLTYRIIKKYNLDAYCCGFTSQLLTNPQGKRLEYIKLFNKDSLVKSGKVKLSYHYYSYTHQGYSTLRNAGLDSIRGGLFTEFNIATKITEDNFHKEFNSSYYVSELVKLLEFSYQNDVKTIYLFNLMDNEDKEGKMGHFDIHAKPKPAYLNVLKIRDVVKDGFYIDNSGNYYKLTGKVKSIIVAKKSLNLSDWESKLEFSSVGAGAKKVPVNEWIIIRNN